MTNTLKSRGRKKKWNVLQSIFFILLVLATGYILLQSPLFEVRRILVKGNNFLSEEKIRSVADIGAGSNIFKQDLVTAASNLRLIPMLKEVKVARFLPSTVVITVKERTPRGILPSKDGFIEVDEEGVCLMNAGAGAPGLPVITGVQGEIPGPGQVVRAEKLIDALAVIGGLPGETVASLSEVHVEDDGQIKVYTVEGIQCRLGTAAEIQEKGNTFHSLLLELRKQGAGVKYIDLSCAGQPVIYYKKR